MDYRLRTCFLVVLGTAAWLAFAPARAEAQQGRWVAQAAVNQFLGGGYSGYGGGYSNYGYQPQYYGGYGNSGYTATYPVYGYNSGAYGYNSGAYGYNNYGSGYPAYGYGNSRAYYGNASPYGGHGHGREHDDDD
jgi:hypothetical protein